MIKSIPPEDLSLTRVPAFAFFGESGIDGKLDFDHFCRAWGQLIQLDIASIMLYFDSSHEALGIIGGTVTPCTMTGDLIAQEAFWWVSPQLRGTTVGINLLRKWQDWAREKGAKRIYVGNLYRLNDQKMRQMYERMNYSPLEIHYVKSL